MAINVKDQQLSNILTRNLENAREKRLDSMEKLSSGQVFTKQDPRPADRALSDQMEFRLRSLASSKRNMNDAVSLLQTAEQSLSEINNIVIRLKELNIAAATTTVSDHERRYLFIEYEALRDELTRIATTTEYNGIPLLNGDSDAVPEQLVFRVDDPAFVDGSWSSTDIEDDINAVRFDGIKNMVATAEGLGIQSALDLLESASDEEGISIEDVEEMLLPESDAFPTIYDEALAQLSTQRAVFGAMQSRMQRAMDFAEIYQENIAAAKSNIADTDYAREAVRLAEANILMQASTGLLAQTNFDSNITLNLLTSVTR